MTNGWLEAWRKNETSHLLLPTADDFDLKTAVVVAEPDSDRAEFYAELLLDEVGRRSHCRWKRSGEGPQVRLRVDSQALGHPEGYCLRVKDGNVTIAGADERGLLFGVGRLLREMTLDREQSYATPLRGSAFIDGHLDIVSQPDYAMRQHQIAFRPKTNSYDAFSVELMQREILEQAWFGCNGIEMIPPGLDDAAQSPHFRVDWLEMLSAASEWCDRLDLNVSIWFPLFPGSDKQHWNTVFSAFRRLDALFVPGGDPGGRPAADLFESVAAKARHLREKHFPEAEVWVSSQYGLGVSVDHELGAWRPRERLEAWIEAALKPETKEFLTGLVYGPWTAMPLAEFCERVGQHYPVRNYPDICHSASCEFPVHGWDPLFATTHLREGINPRPRTFAHIIAEQAPLTCGCGCYSEGVNDDVNKVVWSLLHWGSDRRGPLAGADFDRLLHSCLRQYASLLCELPRHADEVVELIYALEEHWSEPLNLEKVTATRQRLARLEGGFSVWHQHNWRVNLLLLRAEFDAFLGLRFQQEKELADRVRACLFSPGSDDADHRIEAGLKLLDQGYASPPARLGKPGGLMASAGRLERYAALLFEQVGYQTTLGFGGQHRQRGAFLETRWIPLHDLQFIHRQLEQARTRSQPLEWLRQQLRHDFKPLIYANFGIDAPAEMVPPYRPLRTGEDPTYFGRPLLEHLASDHDGVLRLLTDGKVPRAWRSWQVCIWPETAVLELRVPLPAVRPAELFLGLTFVGQDLNLMGGDWTELGRRGLATRVSLEGEVLQDWLEPPEVTEPRVYALPSFARDRRHFTLVLEPRDPTEVTVNRVPLPLAELWLSGPA